MSLRAIRTSVSNTPYAAAPSAPDTTAAEGCGRGDLACTTGSTHLLLPLSLARHNTATSAGTSLSPVFEPGITQVSNMCRAPGTTADGAAPAADTYPFYSLYRLGSDV